jgi:hypothetical protein
MRAPPIISSWTVGVATGSEEILDDFTLEINVDVANPQSMMYGSISSSVNASVKKLSRFVHSPLFLGARDAEIKRRDGGQDVFQRSSVLRITGFEEVARRERMDVDGLDRRSA